MRETPEPVLSSTETRFKMVHILYSLFTVPRPKKIPKSLYCNL